MSITLKLIKNYEGCEYFKELIRQVWQGPEDDLVPTPIAMTVLKNGGGLLAAYAEDGPPETGGMVGAAFWWLGSDTHRIVSMDEPAPADLPASPGSLKACSHMAGVLPAWQRRGIGLRLKLLQRELVLRQGLSDRITWTYDPLYCRNGIFNIRRLGGVCSTYMRNVYGEMDDALNRGTPSDRCEIDWYINDDRVVAAASGQPVPPAVDPDTVYRLPTTDAGPFRRPAPAGPPLDGTPLAIPVPEDIAAIRKADSELSLTWRLYMRDMLEQAFAASYQTADCINLEPHGWHYILLKR